MTAVIAEVLAEEDVLREAECHADRGGAEAPVEADPGLQQAGDQRPDERAEVDAEIEQRESAVTARVVFS